MSAETPPPPVRVAIIGCGLIGSRWDMAAATTVAGATPPSLTHAAAFSRQAQARIVGFCDADLGKAEQATAAWRCGRAFADPRALLAAEPVDLVVVATASTERSSVIEAALAAGVRTLVIEKPLATTLDESRHLVAALEAHGAVALVNYLRHWDPALTALRARVAAGEMGRLQRLVGLYGKGLSNNGSHMIDLAGLLTGAQPVKVRALGSPLPADEAAWSQGSDTALDAQLLYRQADGTLLQLDLLATDASAYSCFELKLIGRGAQCEIRHGGRTLDWLPVADDPDFAGYRIPGARQSLPGGTLQAMDAMAAEALQLARREISRAHCDARTALATASAVEAIRQSAREGGAWLTLD